MGSVGLAVVLLGNGAVHGPRAARAQAGTVQGLGRQFLQRLRLDLDFEAPAVRHLVVARGLGATVGLAAGGAQVGVHRAGSRSWSYPACLPAAGQARRTSIRKRALVVWADGDGMVLLAS